MADWITELDKLSKTTGDMIGKVAIDSIKEQIDYEAEEFYQFLLKNTPQNSGELVKSLTKTKVDDINKYGWKIEYAGNYSDGTPHEKVANILNYGTKAIVGKFFRTRAVRRLKGLDERIAIRYKLKLKE